MSNGGLRKTDDDSEKELCLYQTRKVNVCETIGIVSFKHQATIELM